MQVSWYPRFPFIVVGGVAISPPLEEEVVSLLSLRSTYLPEGVNRAVRCCGGVTVIPLLKTYFIYIYLEEARRIFAQALRSFLYWKRKCSPYFLSEASIYRYKAWFR